MDKNEYRELLLSEINVNSKLDTSSTRENFIEYISDLLVNSEELDESIEYLYFEGLAKNRQKVQIDGYSYSELDNVLSLYVIIPLGESIEIESLTLTDANKYLSRAKSFISDVDYILEYAEESAPAYDFAMDVKNRFINVKGYKIYLLTDKLMSRTIKNIDNDILNGKEVEHHIWDIERLYNLYESRMGKEDIIIDLSEFSDYSIPCLSAGKTEEYEAYLCNIPGMLLANLYNKYGGKLLEGNVRSFLQTKGKVNKGIRETILTKPEMFFAYNNGIAATAHNIEMIEKNGVCYLNKITALQIVNGGQTTASLAMALLNDKKEGSEESLKRIFVPMKLSVVSPEKAEKLIPNISRFANSQNKVSDADLWSNHPFHIRMEEISRRIIAPAETGKQYGTNWYYERANGQYKQETYKATQAVKDKFKQRNPKEKMFTKTELAKYMNIKQELPHIASSGGQKSFAKFAESVAKEWDKHNDIFNEGYFKDVVAMAILFRSADKIIKELDWYKVNRSYKANIIAYTLAKIIHTVRTEHQDKTIDYRNLWNRQGLSGGWHLQIQELSKVIYDFLTGDRDIQNVTEWAKREQCWKYAQNLKIELHPEFIKELILKEKSENTKQDEKYEQKQINKINSMLEVNKFGFENWKKLIIWNQEENKLTDMERDLLLKSTALISKGKYPNEKQCNMLMKVLERAYDEGFICKVD